MEVLAVGGDGERRDEERRRRSEEQPASRGTVDTEW